MAQKEITIAQALTYKKRLASAISKTTSDIQKYNSVTLHVKENKDGEEVGTEAPNRNGLDIQKLLDYRKQLKDEMIELKLNLWRSSDAMRKLILQLAEIKDEVTFLSQLDTKDGRAANEDRYDYEDKLKKYDAVVKKAEVDQKLLELTRQIDATQSTIDEFNHSNKIVVNDIGLL